MKKFVLKILVYALCVSLFTLGVNRWYKNNNSDKDNTRKFQTIPENIQICNLGSSHGLYGFCYEDYDGQYTCFNFGMSEQRLSYDFRLLQNYRQHLQEGAVVFIPVSHFSLFGISEESSPSFAAKNKRYYKILPKELVKAYHWDTALYTKYLPVLSAYEDIFRSAIPIKEAESTDWERKASDIDLGKNVLSASEKYVITNQLDENGNRIYNQQEIDALYQIIALCRETNTRPILVTTPYLSEYSEAVRRAAPNFAEDFYGLLEEVTARTGAEYYDYSSDERFLGHYELFMDGDHLNRDGAKKFTNILMQEVYPQAESPIPTDSKH